MFNLRFLKYLWFLPGQKPPLLGIYNFDFHMTFKLGYSLTNLEIASEYLFYLVWSLVAFMDSGLTSATTAICGTWLVYCL